MSGRQTNRRQRHRRLSSSVPAGLIVRDLGSSGPCALCLCKGDIAQFQYRGPRPEVGEVVVMCLSCLYPCLCVLIFLSLWERAWQSPCLLGVVLQSSRVCILVDKPQVPQQGSSPWLVTLDSADPVPPGKFLLLHRKRFQPIRRCRSRFPSLLHHVLHEQ